MSNKAKKKYNKENTGCYKMLTKYNEGLLRWYKQIPIPTKEALNPNKQGSDEIIV